MVDNISAFACKLGSCHIGGQRHQKNEPSEHAFNTLPEPAVVVLMVRGRSRRKQLAAAVHTSRHSSKPELTLPVQATPWAALFML